MVERNADTVAAMDTALHGDAILDGNSSGGVGGGKIIHEPGKGAGRKMARGGQRKYN